MRRTVSELIGEADPFGGVTGREHDAPHCRLVEEVDPDALDAPPRPVERPHTDQEGVGPAGSTEQRGHLPSGDSQVVRMDQTEDPAGIPPAVGIPEHSFVRRAGVENLTCLVDDSDDVVGVLEQVAEPREIGDHLPLCRHVCEGQDHS